MHNALVVGQSRCKKLAALFFKQILREIEALNLAGADWVLSYGERKELHVFGIELAIAKVDIKTALGHPGKEVWPLWSGLLYDYLRLEVNTPISEIRFLKIDKL